MAVLNTTSPAESPRAPMERPRNTVPSARTRTAASRTGTANSRFRCEKAEEACAPPAQFERRIVPRLLLQAKHVVHVVEPRALAAQELGGAQRAEGVSQPALRADGDLDPLARARENH